MRFSLVSILILQSAALGADTASISMAEEDRIEALAPEAQVVAYLALRGRLHADDATQSQRERLERKIALASTRASTAKPTLSQRLEFCRLATEIGRLHLKQEDPERALHWARVAEHIEPMNLWSGALRSTLHVWHRTRLDKDLNAREWARAREVLSRWRARMGDDHAVEQSVDDYAELRTRALRNVLRADGPPAAMRALIEESERYPERKSWRRLRAEIIGAAQEPFDQAVNLRQEEAARQELGRLVSFARDFAVAESIPLQEKREHLEKLALDLRPIPLQRDFGMVRAPALRIEVGAVIGGSEISQAGERFKDTILVPVITADWRRYRKQSSWWWGAGASLVEVDVSGAADTDATGLISDIHVLAGYRGSHWSAWGGTGFVYSPMEFNGQTTTNSTDGQVFGHIRLGGEYALGRSVAIGGDARFGQSDVLESTIIAVTGRYYINANLAVGAQVLRYDVKWRDDAVGLNVVAEGTGVGGVVTIQF